MISNPPAILKKIATGKNVILLAALFLSFAGIIMPAMEADIKVLSGGVGVIDLQFYYSPQKALSMLNSYGPEGIRLYIIAQWTVDLIFPVVAAMFICTVLIWIGLTQWYWLGLMMLFFDWIENVFITILLFQYPEFQVNIALIGCCFTSLKWLTLFLVLTMTLANLVKKLLSWYAATRFSRANSQ